MPQNYQFTDSLIKLRSHYQSSKEDSERSSSHTIEQLNHINALLVDQLVENQQVVDSLLQLRSLYQSLYSEQQQKAIHAREQLNHVNALLADQAILQHKEQQPISIQAATLEQQALLGAITDNSEELPQQEPELVQKPETVAASKQQISSDVSQGDHDGAIALSVGESYIPDESDQLPQQDLEVTEKPQPINESEQQIIPTVSRREQDEEKAELQELKLPETSEQQIPTGSSQVEQQSKPKPSIESPDVEDSPERSRYSPQLKTPLLPQYEYLKKSEAVEKLLQEDEGSVLHLDHIIHGLYGELESKDIKAEKPRMNDTLKKGVAKGLWQRVPDFPGYYTVDLKLVKKDVDPKKAEGNKRQGRKSSTKAT